MSTPVALVTGATSGLGRHLATQLVSRGWEVVVGGRSDRTVGTAVGELGASARPFVADLSDLAAVRRAADELDVARLDAVVANAGLSMATDTRTVDGYETTFAVNVLAHQLLLGLLAPLVPDGGRIVLVSSGVHDPDNKLARRAGVPTPRWVGAEASAQPWDAAPGERIDDTRQRYSNSKLANIMQARELQRLLRAAQREVDVFAYDPGLMVDTDFARSYPAALRTVLRVVGRMATPFVANMRTSKSSSVHLARLVTDAGLEGTGFGYFDGDVRRPPADNALDDDAAAELWRTANRLVGLQPDDPRIVPRS
ncbi:MAG: SDR family NAD(P)-dependent oxidoreductase [Actinomycetota bacterium]